MTEPDDATPHAHVEEPVEELDEPSEEAADQAWLDEQIDAMVGAFGLDEDAAFAAITIATLALEVGDLVADAARDDEDGEPGDLSAGTEALGAYADQVLSSTPGEADDPGEGLDAEDVLALCRLLAEPDTAEATFSQVLSLAVDEEDPAGATHVAALGLGVLAESLEKQVPPDSHAALRWLRGRAHEVLGGLSEAEEAYEDVLAVDATWSPALYDLARIAADRGDAARALSLLRRGDAREDDPLVTTLQSFVPRDRTDIGRNDPCWCGSGRKYKACHRGRETLSLVERLPWLVAKADLHLAYGAAALELDDLAEWWAASQAGIGADADEIFDAAVVATTDPVLRDAVLFAGGGLQAFGDQRGSLLPDDETAVLPALMRADRGVFEVQDTGRAAVRLRPVGDLADPTRIDAAGAGLTGVRRGDLITARLVEVEAAWHAVGAIELVAPDAAARLAQALAGDPSPGALTQAVFDAMPRSSTT